MKLGCLISSLGAALSIAACGSSDDATGVANASAFEGIYQLSAASENSADRSTPGASKLSQLQDQFFVITGSEVFGQKIAVLNSCSSVADCQAKRAAQLNNQFYQIEYTFTLSSSVNATTLSGFEAGTGSGEGTQCVGRSYAEHVLTLAADHSVHLESRTKNLADRPQNNGFCEVYPAKSQAEADSLPCARLEVFDGSFVQAN
ncbi:MAG TPA: hypothetical protein VGJ91_06510 [Polyangiaceae bacterium]|jgi:hypothetical protein